jgi:anti-sigma factor RsiW
MWIAEITALCRKEAGMDCEYRERLNAFHDGELSPPAVRELSRHLETCPACAMELAEIREIARAFSDLAAEDISPAGVARAHEAADAAASELGSPVLRIMGLLAGLAASVLVIASAWLWAGPAPEPPQPQVVLLPAPTPEWERVAMTMEVGPLTGETPDIPGRPMLADARLADWMLQNLSR